MAESSQCLLTHARDPTETCGLHRSRSRDSGKDVRPWKHYGPSVSGCEVIPCFKEGYLFLLIDPVSHEWALYNDTFVYEMHAAFIFGAEASAHPVPHNNVGVSSESAGGLTVTVTVYPMETVVFLCGEKQRYRSTFEGKPLSRTYLENEREAAAEQVSKALAAVVLTGDGGGGCEGAGNGGEISTKLTLLTEEMCLTRCRERSLAFVDPVFYPGDQSLWPHQGPTTALSLPRTPQKQTDNVGASVLDVERNARDQEGHRDGEKFAASSVVRSSLTPCGWQRAKDYLPAAWHDRIELFRGPVTPRSVQRGRLGDSWFVSALAAVAESDSHVRALFGRPSGHLTDVMEEEALGAYRVWLNRDGWWHQLILDEYLPVVGRQPRYARSRDDPCELWVSLLEKAYAKRSGAYANILSGDPLFALRDLTGFPTARLDAAYLESTRSPAGAEAFFSRLAADVENGHLYLFSTPDSSDSRSTSSVFKSNGIFIGYAYTAIGTAVVSRPSASVGATPSPSDSQALQCSSPLRLVAVRNPWPTAGQWKGRWHALSPLWQAYPEAARAFPGSAAGTDDTIVMEWPEEVHRIFVGCGVAYCHFGYADYRMPCAFVRQVPSVCIEVSVTEPTSLTFILSQPDHRGTREQGKDYAPVMLSVACRTSVLRSDLADPITAATEGDEYMLLVQSSWDAEAPSERCTFLQGRDISITYTFEPARSPYLVVPRRLVLGPRKSGTVTTGTDTEELSFVLGVLSQLPFTPLGQAQLRIKHLDGSNPVFQNHATFPNTSTEASATVLAQKKVGCGSTVRETSSLNSLW